MNTDATQLERRGAQRFQFHLPVSVRVVSSGREADGFTQDLSARGALLYTDLTLSPGDSVELTLLMPSEITLAENMRVRCRGTVTRVQQPAVGTRLGVAVHLEGYEFLPETDHATGTRVSALHEHSKAKETPQEVHSPGTLLP